MTKKVNHSKMKFSTNMNYDRKFISEMGHWLEMAYK